MINKIPSDDFNYDSGSQKLFNYLGKIHRKINEIIDHINSQSKEPKKFVIEVGKFYLNRHKQKCICIKKRKECTPFENFRFYNIAKDDYFSVSERGFYYTGIYSNEQNKLQPLKLELGKVYESKFWEKERILFINKSKNIYSFLHLNNLRIVHLAEAFLFKELVDIKLCAQQYPYRV